MEKVLELRSCVDSLSKDSHKFFQRNNKAAGVRARKKLQKCKKLAQEIRIMIQRKKQENFQKKSAAAASMAALTGGNTLIGEKFAYNENFYPVGFNFDFSQDRSLVLFPFPDFPQNSYQNVDFQNFDKNLSLSENFQGKIGEMSFFHPSFDE